MDRHEERFLTTMKFGVVALALMATMCHGRDIAAPHIINGEEVKPHSYPHQVAIKLGRTDSVSCGGSLISDQWVITAAHCAQGRSNIYVVAGAHDIKNREEESQQMIHVEKIIVHPEWNMKKIRNDLALLKLDTPVHIDGKTVKPIRLPKRSHKNKSFWFWEATMTGWGNTAWLSSEGPATLRSATERVMTNVVCKASFLFRLVEDTNICTHGMRSKGTCHGDSGGPLIIQEADKENTLIGITSFGFPICDLKWPSVFVRVSSYVDWIHKETGIPVRE